MAIKTPQEYYESMKDVHPTTYILGEKVANAHEHPLIKHMMASVAKTFEMENDEEGMNIMKVLGQNMAWLLKKTAE